MSSRSSVLPHIVIFPALLWLPAIASAAPITGTVEPTTPTGQYMALTMTIEETTTTFELTGPDYSWFAFGFDTTWMFGYSLIVEGTGEERTVVERNLEGTGNPGSPQSTQNISVVDILHDDSNNLTTVMLERASHTGDPDDPDFTTSMSELDLIWAYSSSASPESPIPNLQYHGGNGRGFSKITFSPIPEPASVLLVATTAAAALISRRRQG